MGNSLSSLNITNKIKVFISSKCGNGKYDTIRKELKESLQNTGMTEVYLFEDAGASSRDVKTHYLKKLRESDVCIFLIDNKDGISEGVNNEFQEVQKNKIKSLFYFCDEQSKAHTIIERAIITSGYAKSKTVHTFDELKKHGFQDLMEDVAEAYCDYCKGRLVEENEQNIVISSMELTSKVAIPKNVLKDMDKCKAKISKEVLGLTYRSYDEQEHTSEIDELAAQFLEILLEHQSIKKFNVGYFLEQLSKKQSAEYHKVVKLRWAAIQAYFLGKIEECDEKLSEAYELAKETKQPSWVQNDILIDRRNQLLQIYESNNQIGYENEAEQKLKENNEALYYPVLDRAMSTLKGYYTKEEFKNSVASIGTVTLVRDRNKYIDSLTNAYIIPLYNGSLTQLLLIYDRLKECLFYLTKQTPDEWSFKKSLLKFSIFLDKPKEIRGLQKNYPDMTNKLNAEEALEILDFCFNEPISYKRNNKIIKAMDIIGYYLDDKEFARYEQKIIEMIDCWLDDENRTLLEMGWIFKMFSHTNKRFSNLEMTKVCIKFMKNNLKRYYREMFKFMSSYLYIEELPSEMITDLINTTILMIRNEGLDGIVYEDLYFLIILTNQNNKLSQKLDNVIKEVVPEFYNGLYSQEKEIPISEMVKCLIPKIKNRNINQGKNGGYSDCMSFYQCQVKHLLMHPQNNCCDNDIENIIEVVTETLMLPNQLLPDKQYSILVLILIILKYPDIYQKNKDRYEELYINDNKISICELDIFHSNQDTIRLTIASQLLFNSMGKDVTGKLFEYLAAISGNTKVIKSVAEIMDEYVEMYQGIPLSSTTEMVIFSQALQWSNSECLDVREHAINIMLFLYEFSSYKDIIDRKLCEIVDEDSVEMKYLILKRIVAIKGMAEETKQYIYRSCKNDGNYVIRKSYQEVCEQETIGNIK